MGAYLAKPITSKESEDGSFSQVQYGSSAMQGWRVNMEDEHISKEFCPGSGMGLFAVFDGHGGKESSTFCKKHFQQQLQARVEANKGDIAVSLRQAFHQMDTMMRDPSRTAEIASMSHAAAKESAAKEVSGSPKAGGSPVKPAPAPTVGEKAASMVKASVNSALDEARKKGKLTQKEAMELMIKMMAVQRMEKPGAKGGGEGADDAPGAAAASAKPEGVQAGCTANVLVLTKTEIFVANAGDSRAVLCNAGNAIALSVDHKPNDAVERDRIEKAGGWITNANGHFRVNGNLNLSRAIGDLKYKGDASISPAAQVITAEPDVTVRRRDKGDEFIVVGCDGIWDCMSNEEVVTLVRQRLKQGVARSKICEEVFDRCISTDPKQTAGIGGDNMTCTIVTIKS